MHAAAASSHATPGILDRNQSYVPQLVIWIGLALTSADHAYRTPLLPWIPGFQIHPSTAVFSKRDLKLWSLARPLRGTAVLPATTFLLRANAHTGRSPRPWQFERWSDLMRRLMLDDDGPHVRARSYARVHRRLPGDSMAALSRFDREVFRHEERHNQAPLNRAPGLR